MELHEHRGAAPVPAGGRLGLYHFAILLPNRETLGRFVSHLAEHGVRYGASHHLVSEALYLQDPDGLGIEVYADLPRSSWQHENRQLKMDTRPLNLRDLAAAGGGDVWRGMPRHTTIGHLHLHVGELTQAERFYHEGLGLDKMVWSYPGALFLGAGGYHHHLGVNSWAAFATSPGGGEAKLLEWEIVVPSEVEVRATLEGLSAVGAEVDRSGSDGVVADPWGTRLRIRSGGTQTDATLEES
ncbi:catechol 2,3-dioxygenase [soil metagenome]